MGDLLLKFELKKNGKARLHVDGDPPELLAGVLTMIKSLYQQILVIDKADAEWFLVNIAAAIVDPECPLYEEVRE